MCAARGNPAAGAKADAGGIAVTTAYPLMETFASIQGEGYHAGRPAFFIRLGGCDIGCTWCDVKASWDVAAHPVASVGEILSRATAQPIRFAVVTGGEPCLYDLGPLCDALKGEGFTIALETSGACPVRGRFDWICVSPKKFRFPLDENLGKADELKVIVFNDSDFEWAEQHAALAGPSCRLFLQPEYGKSAEMLPRIFHYLQRHPHWRLSLQVHKILGVP